MIGNLIIIIEPYRDKVQSYLTLLGGSACRLIISLFYFILVANSLDLNGFGLFATASATGIILSRFFAFGFVSPHYRIAASKSRLLGVYSSGLLFAGLLSIPIIIFVAYLLYLGLFSAQMLLWSFMAIILAEILFWRGLEITIIVLNGLNKFFVASSLLVMGTFAKLVAAIWLAYGPDNSLAAWSLYYMLANLTSCLIGVGLFYPRVRLKWRLELYISRWVESLAVATSELIFFAQAELDKLIVLAIGGPQIAGLYAILMRLIDLTALPIRSLITLLVQSIMRSKSVLRSLRNIVLIELSIGTISFGGILAMAICLYLFPNILGENVAPIAPYLFMVLFIPVFRNLIETHSELLYAVNLTVRRTVIAALLGLFKAAIITLFISHFSQDNDWISWLNLAFLLVYAASLILSYLPIRRAVKWPS